MFQKRIAITALSALGLAAFLACSGSEEAAHDVTMLTGQEALGAGNAGPDRPANEVGASDPVKLPRGITLSDDGAFLCSGAPCQCSNGVDDDGDGTVDGFDVECTGGIDDDEGTFATGIPGDNRDPKWQDCFFDGNSGAGDDRCRYRTECLTGELAPDHPDCEVAQACRDNCQPRTPRGCDCFGCCAVELPGGGGEFHVTLSDSCSTEKLGDAEACPVCVPSDACGNPAPEEPAPEEPAPEEPAPEEPAPEEPAPEEPAPEEPPAAECNGRSSCSVTTDCAMGEFCSMGCCLVVIR